MSIRRSTSPIASVSLIVASIIASCAVSFAAPATRQPADLDGVWEIAIDNRGQSCRVVLRAQQSDKGDYFLGMPPACRHAMPALAKVGRWTMPDATHLTLSEPTGAPVLKLAALGDGFTANQEQLTYTLRPAAETGRSAVGPALRHDAPAAGAAIVPIAKRGNVAGEALEKPTDLAGRYAVMREKRDTGCMLTLDLARTKGGTRAQLAPGCRDQGIVVFDPSAWQIVKGELVLTARAGHKAHLLKSGEGAWQKDPKDGGKPLGLKRL